LHISLFSKTACQLFSLAAWLSGYIAD